MGMLLLVLQLQEVELRGEAVAEEDGHPDRTRSEEDTQEVQNKREGKKKRLRGGGKVGGGDKRVEQQGGGGIMEGGGT